MDDFPALRRAVGEEPAITADCWPSIKNELELALALLDRQFGNLSELQDALDATGKAAAHAINDRVDIQDELELNRREVALVANLAADLLVRTAQLVFHITQLTIRRYPLLPQPAASVPAQPLETP